jgi:uncharacterized protein (TIGR00297 family)
VIARALAGFLLAGAIAFLARRANSLSTSGAFAALAVGTGASIAGWGWAILVIVFFVLSSAVSRFRRAAREARIGGIVEKTEARDAYQVLANGGVFTAAVLIGYITADPLWNVAALGALAAAAGDTWATEVGTIAGGTPRSIVTLAPLPPGTSGGITAAGTVASAVGSAMVAAVAHLTGVGAFPGAVFLGGLSGSLADSLAGATVQERRWCDTCERGTERRVHSCGQRTRVVGGIRGIRNDFVNVVCTVVGAVVAVAGTFIAR